MIHWADLAKVAWVSLAFGAGIAVVFALGVVGTAQVEAAKSARSVTAIRLRGYLIAGTCFAACAAAALFGIYLIVPQFHR